MAGLVNIGEGNKDDGFYRYKMPKLITKIEGRGNGIKTNLVNMVDVAKALSRPPSYVTKYFGCVLGAQSKFEEKTATSTVNGAHETAKLVQLLEGFIKKFVQCYGCGNPETEILISKKQMITLKCAACGFLSDVDMRDKLTTFILNNPPEQKKSKAGAQMRRAEKERLKAGEAADKASKKKGSSSKKEGSKKTKKKDGDDGDSPVEEPENDLPEEAAANDEDDDVVWQTDTSASAAEKRMREQLTAAASEMVDLSIVEKAKQGKNEGAEHAAGQNGNSAAHVEEEEGEDEEDEAASAKAQLIEEIKDYFNTHNLSETAKYIKEKGPATFELLCAVFEAIFDGVGKGLSKEVGKKRLLFGKVVDDEEAQLNLIYALEHFCVAVNKSAQPEISKTIKELYDSDILEEEQIFEWYGKCSEKGCIDAEAAKVVRKEAAPLIAWLKEAEAESEEEE